MLKKFGDATQIRVKDYSSVQQLISPSILSEFTKQAKELKKIAPKADDFLYFSTVMMHAAEAACINEDGSPKLYKGKAVTSSWDESTGSYIWKCSDPSILPYRNQRGDIFPEAELIKAHKEWVGKPLCIDHKADSMDHTRGFIVDTYYDYDLKRIVALAAIDKKTYPDLASKVKSGMSDNVSMGTGVGRAICTEKGCHRVIKSAHEFCDHMKYKSGYGEINLDLSPIELSIVVAGADKRAKIKHIIASVDTLNSYVKSKEDLLKKGSNDKDLKLTSTILKDLKEFIDKSCEELEELKAETSEIDDEQDADFDLSDVQEEPDGQGLQAPSSARLANELFEMKKASFDLEQRLEAMHKKVSDISTLSLIKTAKDLDEKVSNFNVTLSSNVESEDSTVNEKTYHLSTDDLGQVEEFLDSVCEELKDIQESSKDLDSQEDKKQTLDSVTDNIESKISSLKQQFSNLVKGYNMTIDKKAYFQGGGGVNEPTPGVRKYPADPMNDKLRQEDHHMKGQKPFPDVGDVEKLYPGIASVKMDELERKKMLARAELEEKALKRASVFEAVQDALSKKAYYHGGGGVNEPSPGKVKYPADPMNEKLREKDHHMQGQKPFPGVGDVDGLHPSPESVDEKDELKRKKMLSRATSLKGFLVKGAALGDYVWKVCDADDNVLFKDTVRNLANGSEVLYTAIASAEFGKDLVSRVQKQAFTKMAQEVAAPAPAPVPVPQAPQSMPTEMPAMDQGDMNVPEENPAGDIKDTALDLAVKVRDLSSDLVEAVQSLTGEQEQMGEVSPKAASSSLFKIQREANEALNDVLVEMVSDLDDRKEELVQVASMIDAGKVNSANTELFESIANASFDETKKALAQGKALIGTYLKYARGVQGLVKQAELEEEMSDLGEADDDTAADFEDDGESLRDILDRVDSEMSDLDDDLDGDEDMDSPVDDEMSDVDLGDEDDLSSDDELEKDLMSEDMDSDVEDMHSDDEMDTLLADMVEVKTPDGKTVKAPAGSEVKSASRIQMRAKIAAKAMALSGVAGELADSVRIGGIDGSGDTTVSENIVDQQEKTMSVVLGKVKVRKEAERIHQLVSQGEIDSSDLDSLVSFGVDPEAVKYYKEFYSEVEGGKDFATELTKEHKKSQASDELESFKVKIARAYDLVNDMVRKDLCSDDRDAISNKVNEVVEFNDAAFDSLKRIVANAPSPNRKVASLPVSGLMPQIGLYSEEDSSSRVVKNSSVDVYMEALQGGRSSRTSR